MSIFLLSLGLSVVSLTPTSPVTIDYSSDFEKSSNVNESISSNTVRSRTKRSQGYSALDEEIVLKFNLNSIKEDLLNLKFDLNDFQDKIVVLDVKFKSGLINRNDYRSDLKDLKGKIKGIKKEIKNKKKERDAINAKLKKIV